MKKQTLVFFLIVVIVVIGGYFVFSKDTEENVEIAEENKALNDRVIKTLEAKFAESPDNIQFALGLSNAYLQEVRESGDITYFDMVVEVLDIAEVHHAGDVRIRALRADVANKRHEFMEGLRLIDEAIAIDPQKAAYYGIKSDSELELGLYDAAEASLQKMVDLKPNFSSYARVAYQRELHGDPEGALEALELAISAGSTYPENVAWALVESGNLMMGEDMTDSQRAFMRALKVYPEYPPAIVGLAQIAYHDGSIEEAETMFLKAYEIQPTGDYAEVLADFYGSIGSDREAEFVRLTDQDFQNATGENVDMEYAHFLADFGDVDLSLELAEKAYQARPSIHGADVYAWSLYRAEQFELAQEYIEEAMRLETEEGAMLYHAALIAEANGDEVAYRDYLERAQEAGLYGELKYQKTVHERLAS